MSPYIWIFIWIVLWMAIAIAVLKIIETKKVTSSKTKSDEIIDSAKKEADLLIKESKKESSDIIAKAEKLEEKILEREEKIEKKISDIEEKQEKVISRNEELKEEKIKLLEKKDELDGKLSEISKLSESEAKDLFLKQISEKYEGEAINLIQKHKVTTEENKKEIAREILIKSMQQYAWDVTSEVTTTLIPLPNDDLKWKLIGKEWRNIVAFEKATEVALIIDDTPDSVFISGFDLFKRYIAKKSLEKLLEDWRIQPARIEEVVETITQEADVLLKDIWRKVLDDLNITDIPEQILPIIWKLRFRSSYWQNIIKHSTEVALIAESIARDLWVDPYLAKVGWLLHDLWKALDHDIEWTHPEIGWKVARKYWIKEEVIDMIENHHWDQFSISIYAAIVQIADAVSSVRPWARRENIEQYIKRVKEMESLVASFSWVNKAYAISAWREVRVFVDSNLITDLEAINLAKEIADTIQDKLNYPWNVKVNLVRELKVIEYAK